MGERVTSDMLRSLNHSPKHFLNITKDKTKHEPHPKTFPYPQPISRLLFSSAAFYEVLRRLFGLPLARSVSTRGSQRKQPSASMARG